MKAKKEISMDELVALMKTAEPLAVSELRSRFRRRWKPKGVHDGSEVSISLRASDVKACLDLIALIRAARAAQSSA